MVERGELLESIPAFYVEDMIAQENQERPRVGRAAQLANEQQVLSRSPVHEARALHLVVDGDVVVIHWLFDLVLADGATIRMEEIALQTWRGDRIEREQYFYDPAQRRPVPAVRR